MINQNPSDLPSDETTEDRAARVVDEVLKLSPSASYDRNESHLPVAAVEEFAALINEYEDGREGSGKAAYKAVILFAVGHYKDGGPDRVFPLPVLGVERLTSVVLEALRVNGWTRQKMSGTEEFVKQAPRVSG